jgi:superfamily I DNA and/or RNA helicase
VQLEFAPNKNSGKIVSKIFISTPKGKFMVKHIVFMKFPEFSLAQKAKEKLLSMRENISELKDIEVGIDFSKSERSYDLALITLFDTKEDLEKYRVHPYHQEIVKWLKENNTKTKVVDYETNPS